MGKDIVRHKLVVPVLGDPNRSRRHEVSHAFERIAHGNVLMLTMKGYLHCFLPSNYK
jgi:hypothetical protein